MKRLFRWLMVGLVGVSSAGCARVQTKVVQKPRVDQEITQGNNKGFLKGSGPAGGEHRKTRDMLETNVELPTWAEMNPWRKGKQEAAPAGAAKAPAAPAPVEAAPAKEWQPQEDYSAPVAERSVPASAGGESYTVQKGDTLQKISKKYYGTTKKWYKIYRANYDVLKSPDTIRPGQRLTIPSLPKTAEADIEEEGSNEYK